jgi:hypothetical protein
VRRRIRTPLLLLTVAALVLGARPLAGAQVAVPEPSGPDFRAVLLADPGVTRGVKAALRDGTATAQPAAFADVTGEGTSDAIVVVRSPGAAGAVAAYVLSTLGDRQAELQVVFRSQTLYRATVRAAGGALVLRTPAYTRGDDLCCPAATLQRTYVYDREAAAFRRTDSRRFARS